MLRLFFAYSFILICPFFYGQKTIISGHVKDEMSGESLPYVKVKFIGSKIGTLTDSIGNYRLDTYYATDSLLFTYPGYLSQKHKVKLDKEQSLSISLSSGLKELDEVVISAPAELSSTSLHKKLVANKKTNNKEKLSAYQYNLYTKTQMDVNNLGDKFAKSKLIKNMGFLLSYMDTIDNDNYFLPVILNENYSSYYYKKTPKLKREIVEGTYITGIENAELNQFFGEMYMDVNLYDNIISIFNKPFVSPTAYFARTYYKFYLEDSSFIDNSWCYKLSFLPKRTGDLTFEGEMWINDTTYALKLFKAKISPGSNLNYIQDLYFEHEFLRVEKEVWMLGSEKIIADVRLNKESKAYGFFARRYSSRSDFVINKPKDNLFYLSENTVEITDGAKNRKEDFWEKKRSKPLSTQEKSIDLMIDSLNNDPFFKSLKNLTYFAGTGYYPVGKIEIGNVFRLASVNPVENFRMSVALRTSKAFSRIIEFGGHVAYGIKDERFKYGATIRWNLSKKKRALLKLYYYYDVDQIGRAQNTAAFGSSFSTVFSTTPFDKLTLINKVGASLEKDFKKDLILFNSFELKELTSLGKANYVTDLNGVCDTTPSIRSFEIKARIRWTKDEEFIAGAFGRKSLRSKFPVFYIEGTVGIKGVLGSGYEYQKIEFGVSHNRQIGVLGRLKYGLFAGYVFGNTAYPFLKLHPGNQSYWLSNYAYNKMDFLEFISDRYVSAYFENHWDGLFFDRIPLIKKLKLRMVTSVKALYGGLSLRHQQEMLIPDFVTHFGQVPYVELGVGLENIFKFIRVDLVYRATHQRKNVSPFGVRATYYLSF